MTAMQLKRITRFINYVEDNYFKSGEWEEEAFKVTDLGDEKYPGGVILHIIIKKRHDDLEGIALTVAEIVDRIEFIVKIDTTGKIKDMRA